MANWDGVCRSNYFRVKDKAAFRIWFSAFEANSDATLVEEDDKFCFYSMSGSMPTYQANSGEEVEFCDEIASQLVEGEVCVIMSGGYENARYVTGEALAINSKGDVVTVSLNDIYALAAKTFCVPVETISACEY